MSNLQNDPLSAIATGARFVSTRSTLFRPVSTPSLPNGADVPEETETQGAGRERQNTVMDLEGEDDFTRTMTTGVGSLSWLPPELLLTHKNKCSYG